MSETHPSEQPSTKPVDTTAAKPNQVAKDVTDPTSKATGSTIDGLAGIVSESQPSKTTPNASIDSTKVGASTKPTSGGQSSTSTRRVSRPAVIKDSISAPDSFEHPDHPTDADAEVAAAMRKRGEHIKNQICGNSLHTFYDKAKAIAPKKDRARKASRMQKRDKAMHCKLDRRGCFPERRGEAEPTGNSAFARKTKIANQRMAMQRRRETSVNPTSSNGSIAPNNRAGSVIPGDESPGHTKTSRVDQGSRTSPHPKPLQLTPPAQVQTPINS
ncbi:hypothetical protein BDW02DRAFT_594863 [Decorospora gaudefroyi]|uniref:Uncharacterized protein n=1 Tax=Decorospora gaudefroyi TaxID=184978 RepID=A0A6A5KSG9_9PLEO|nr:hypothetical protein BDW02DRAFT_594863 [Decorospora gaudefroyi]